MARMKESNYNILIVNDEKKICGILSEILKDEGYSVRIANNGKDAQEVIKGLMLYLYLFLL